MDNDVLYYLGFSNFCGIGPLKMARILDQLKSVKKAYWEDRKILGEIVGKKTAEDFVAFRNVFDPVKTIDSYKKQGIMVTSMGSQSYPENLKNITDPPICLYIKGNFKPANFFSIVGTRKPTRYGEKVARQISYDLARSGLAIVSGLAMGVDAVAHRAALDAKGYTVAVLGCGVDVVYPAMHLWLYRKIIDSGGAIVSEFPPRSRTLKGMFVTRNRIVSGLSRGVLVVEGGRHSGTLVTARYAAEQGRDLFAVPGTIDSEAASAPNFLIKQGAQLITGANDILSEYQIKIPNNTRGRVDLTGEEKSVMELIDKEPLSVDDLVVSLNQSANKVLNLLTLMELKGIVERNLENKYRVKPY